jgi:hypothetical protein
MIGGLWWHSVTAVTRIESSDKRWTLDDRRVTLKTLHKQMVRTGDEL